MFLTGLPRSGTTWAGRALAAATGSVIVDEPFNLKWHPDRIGYHLKYLPSGLPAQELIHLLRQEIRHWRRPRRLIRTIRAGRVLVRDVHICLAIEHVWEHLRPQTVLMLRHPCGVASSWRSVGFRVDHWIQAILSQENLIVDFLRPYLGHLRSRSNFWFQVGAVWGASTMVMHQLSQKYPQWQWVTHESLCIDPLAGYRRLLGLFDMPMKDQGVAFLTAHDRPPKDGEGPFSVARLSAQEPDKWKSLLTREQIRAVLAGTEPFDILDVFYPRSGSPV